MKKLLSIQDRKLVPQVDKSENELNQFLCDNWKALFPEFTFVSREFSLSGTVHPSGSSGRIDILAYNPLTKRFVVFELKKNYDRNIGHQAADYQDFIQDNFTKIHKAAFQKNQEALPHGAVIDDEDVEIVLVAKNFLPHQIQRAKKESLVTLIEYNWFENGLLLLDYIHYNVPTMKPAPPKTAHQKAKNVDIIWKRIQRGTKIREEHVANITDPVKIEKNQIFFRIVYECIAAKDAKRLYKESAQRKRPFFTKNAERILDLEQNAPDKKESTM